MCHSSNYHWKWNGTTTSNNNNSQPQNVCINWGISEVEGLNDGYGLPYTQHPPPTHPCSPTQTRICQDLMWLAVRIPGPARYHALGNIIFRDTTQDYIVYELRGRVVGLADSCVFVDCWTQLTPLPSLLSPPLCVSVSVVCWQRKSVNRFCLVLFRVGASRTDYAKVPSLYCMYLYIWICNHSIVVRSFHHLDLYAHIQ